jgi:hypothetical protein
MLHFMFKEVLAARNRAKLTGRPGSPAGIAVRIIKAATMEYGAT